MYWTRSEKIIISGGGIVKCDECPCPSYLIVGRCDYTWDGPPACSCDPVGAYRGSVSLTRAIVDESGIKIQEEQTDSNGNRIMVCVPIETVLPDDAYGHIYHALETSDGKPVLYCSMEKLQEHVRSFGSRNENGDLIPNSHEEYWGKLLLDKCPCACQYVRALSCGTLEDGSSEVLPFDILHWNRQDYNVRAVEWNGALWLENPHYKSYRKTRYWLKDCTEYPAEEVHGTDYLINDRLDSKTKRQSLKLVQLSPLFDTSQEASDWGKDWPEWAFAILICQTCTCRCPDKILGSAPAGWRGTLRYTATVYSYSYSTRGDTNSWYTSTINYSGHNIRTAERYNHPSASLPGVSFPNRLENDEFGFPVQVDTHTAWGGSEIKEDSSDSSYVEPNASPTIGSYNRSDCSVFDGQFSGLPGLDPYRWPNDKNPTSSASCSREGWTLPEFTSDAPWPHGTWEMNYSETETTEDSYTIPDSSGNDVLYTSKNINRITAHVEFTLEPFFDEDYPDSPPENAAGCRGGGTARSAAMPPQTSGTYWRIYHQLSDDLKA